MGTLIGQPSSQQSHRRPNHKGLEALMGHAMKIIHFNMHLKFESLAIIHLYYLYMVEDIQRGSYVITASR